MFINRKPTTRRYGWLRLTIKIKNSIIFFRNSLNLRLENHQPGDRAVKLAIANHSTKKPQTIMSWDMSRVRDYLVRRHHFAPAHVEAMEVEYKRYVELRATYPDKVMPTSSEVDPMWHAHILFTKDYAAMCESVGIAFVHHKPTESDVEERALNKEYEQNTLALYSKHFGEPSRQFWPVNAAICW